MRYLLNRMNQDGHWVCCWLSLARKNGLYIYEDSNIFTFNDRLWSFHRKLIWSTKLCNADVWCIVYVTYYFYTSTGMCLTDCAYSHIRVLVAFFFFFFFFAVHYLRLALLILTQTHIRGHHVVRSSSPSQLLVTVRALHFFGRRGETHVELCLPTL